MKKFFLRQKGAFAKFQNITKGTADATLEYFSCGFVGHFKIKYMFCIKTYKKISNAKEGKFGSQLLNSLVQNRLSFQDLNYKNM